MEGMERVVEVKYVIKAGKRVEEGGVKFVTPISLCDCFHHAGRWKWPDFLYDSIVLGATALERELESRGTWTAAL